MYVPLVIAEEIQNAIPAENPFVQYEYVEARAQLPRTELVEEKYDDNTSNSDIKVINFK